MWVIARFIVIAKLYADTDKGSKTVLVVYIVIFTLSLAWSSASVYLLFSGVMYYILMYTYFAAEISLYSITIIYLKKKLGKNMPLAKTFRFIKEKCTNRPLVED